MAQRQSSADVGAALTMEVQNLPRRGASAQGVGAAEPLLSGGRLESSYPARTHSTTLGPEQPLQGAAGLFYSAWSQLHLCVWESHSGGPPKNTSAQRSPTWRRDSGGLRSSEPIRRRVSETLGAYFSPFARISVSVRREARFVESMLLLKAGNGREHPTTTYCSS